MTGGVVVVLGRTGLNFAAGMSGGIAYVWDPDGSFEASCNLDQVELEPIAHEATEAAPLSTGVDLSDMTRHDAIRLRGLIERHQHYTNSARAREILSDWERSVVQCVKGRPVAYRRALPDSAAARAPPVARGTAAGREK